MACKRKRQRPNTRGDGRSCFVCGSDDTPQWRKIMMRRSLVDACNKCGIAHTDYTRRIRRDLHRAPTDAEVDNWMSDRLDGSQPISDQTAAEILVSIGYSPSLSPLPNLSPAPLASPSLFLQSEHTSIDDQAAGLLVRLHSDTSPSTEGSSINDQAGRPRRSQHLLVNVEAFDDPPPCFEPGLTTWSESPVSEYRALTPTTVMSFSFPVDAQGEAALKQQEERFSAHLARGPSFSSRRLS